jgi:uncharacterized membrane protein
MPGMTNGKRPSLSETERRELCKKIEQWIEAEGSVPPVRKIGEQFDISPTTAWRIVQMLEWKADGHHWVRVNKGE